MRLAEIVRDARRAKAQTGRALIAQMIEMLRLRYGGYGITPDYYFNYRLFDPAMAKDGEMVTITLSVTNNGLSDAYSVIIEDPLPTSLFETSSLQPCTPNSPTGFVFSKPVVGSNTVVTYTGGNIAKGQTVTFCFKGTLKKRCLNIARTFAQV